MSGPIEREDGAVCGGRFVKIYGSILDSSVWGESHTTVRVWITMLAMAGDTGMVRSSRSGLARRATVTPEELEEALAILGAPDRDDSSGIEDGRRVLRRQGGWLVVNHGRYRDMRTGPQTRSASRQQRWRDKQKAERNARNANNVTSPPDLELDKDLDLDQEPDREREKRAHTHVASDVPDIPDQQVVQPIGADPNADVMFRALRKHCPQIEDHWAFAEQLLGYWSPRHTPEIAVGAIQDAGTDSPPNESEAKVRARVKNYLRKAPRNAVRAAEGTQHLSAVRRMTAGENAMAYAVKLKMDEEASEAF